MTLKELHEHYLRMDTQCSQLLDEIEEEARVVDVDWPSVRSGGVFSEVPAEVFEDYSYEDRQMLADYEGAMAKLPQHTRFKIKHQEDLKLRIGYVVLALIFALHRKGATIKQIARRFGVGEQGLPPILARNPEEILVDYDLDIEGIFSVRGILSTQELLGSDSDSIPA